MLAARSQCELGSFTDFAIAGDSFFGLEEKVGCFVFGPDFVAALAIAFIFSLPNFFGAVALLAPWCLFAAASFLRLPGTFTAFAAGAFAAGAFTAAAFFGTESFFVAAIFFGAASFFGAESFFAADFVGEESFFGAGFFAPRVFASDEEPPALLPAPRVAAVLFGMRLAEAPGRPRGGRSTA